MVATSAPPDKCLSGWEGSHSAMYLHACTDIPGTRPQKRHLTPRLIRTNTFYGAFAWFPMWKCQNGGRGA